MIDEKVLIERLEKLYDRNDKTKEIAYKEQDWEKFDLFTHRCEGIYSAIQIAKDLASEHNNDFCEWRKENSNKYVCDAHAEIHDSRVLDWCDCPYCGKKIKVVE